MNIENIIKDFNSWLNEQVYKDYVYCSLSESQIDDKTVLYVDTINVVPEHRGKKIASQIMNKITKMSDEHEVFLFLEISEYSEISSDILREFYSKYNFEPSDLVGDYGEIYFREYNKLDNNPSLK